MKKRRSLFDLQVFTFRRQTADSRRRLEHVRPAGPLLTEARGNWSALKAAIAKRSSYTEAEREAFQLLHASLIYEIDAVFQFPDDRVHDVWRSERDLAPLSWVMDLEEPMLFGSVPELASEAVAEMHLASAAIRIPVAVQKVIEARPAAAKAFPSLWQTGPLCWPRARLYQRFGQVKALGECRAMPLGPTVEDRLENALTVVMVLRDDFGHGETGDPQLMSRAE